MNRIGQSGVAPILQSAARLNTDGRLLFADGEGAFRTTVVLKAGKIIDVRPERRTVDSLLGERLVRQGVISKADLKRGLSRHKKGRGRIGQVLVEAGVVTDAQVQAAVDVQCQDALYALFDFRSGTYEEIPATGDVSKPTMTPISVENAIAEGFSRAEEWPLIRARINNYGMVLEQSQGLGSGSQLDGDSLGVLPLIDGKKTVRGVIEASGLGEFRTLKALTVLMSRDRVTIRRKKGYTDDPMGRSSRSILARAGVAVWNLAIIGVLALGVIGLSQSGRRAPLHELELSVFRVDRGLVTRGVGRALESYRLIHGQYPERLQALRDAGLLSGSLLDGLMNLGAEYTSIKNEYEFRLAQEDE